MFFSLARAGSTISDMNRHLINFYKSVALSPEDLMKTLSELEREFNATPQEKRKDWHLSVRKSFNRDSLDDLSRAALFLALNKTSFNGLYRENSAGFFNVPFNAKTGALKLFEPANFTAASQLLRETEILEGSYLRTIEACRAGDLVYFDPPYVPISKTSDFTSYVKEGFSERDQIELADAAEELVQRGVHVVLSNSFCDWVVRIYEARNFEVTSIDVLRGISASASSRGKIKEALIVGRS